MIPGGKTIHDMVLDGSGKPVPVGGFSSEDMEEILETATAGDYEGEWNDDLRSGERKI